MLTQERATCSRTPSAEFVLFDSAAVVITAKRPKVSWRWISISSPILEGTDFAMLEEFCKLGVRHIVSHSPTAAGRR